MTPGGLSMLQNSTRSGGQDASKVPFNSGKLVTGPHERHWDSCPALSLLHTLCLPVNCVCESSHVCLPKAAAPTPRLPPPTRGACGLRPSSTLKCY